MRTTCTQCQQPFEAASIHLQLDHPPVCPTCQRTQPVTVTVSERVSLNDRPGEAPLKEGELRG